MALNYTIRTFINNRWIDAKEELTRQDPTFTAAMQSYEFLRDKLSLPDSIFPSARLLNERWIRLLEATETVYFEIETLRLTASLIRPNASRRTTHHHFDHWIQDAYNLCEKVKTLITHSCRVHQLGKLADKYCEEIDSTAVQGKIGRLRHPQVHGEGGGGSVVRRAISEDAAHSWEFYVATGPEILDYMRESESSDGLSPTEWSKLLGDHTITLLANISGVLRRLDQDINKVRQKPA